MAQKKNISQNNSSANESVLDVRQKETSMLRFLLPILLLTFFAYLPIFNADFVNWDDADYVLENANIRSFANFKAIVTEPVQGNYHPLTMLSLALNYAISGEKAFSYHLFNLILHLLNVVLVFIFSYRFFDKKQWIAFVTALFFAIHPLHVESVAWVAERKDVLYSFFFLLGLISYTNFSQNRSLKSFLFTFLYFILAILSKPAAIIFPVLLFALDFFKENLKDLKFHLCKIPFFAISVFMGLLTLSAQTHVGAVDTSSSFPFWHKMFFASYGLMTCFIKLLLPLNLSPFYPFPPINQSLPFTYYFSMLFVLLGIFVVFFLLKKYKIVAFGVLFYVINLLLVLQIVSVGSAVIAERYTYLPYIGIFFIIGYFFEAQIEQNKGKIPLGYASVLIFFSLCFTFLSFKQVRVWKNGTTLWEHTITTQESSRAYSNRAQLYKKEKNYEKALELYGKALKMNIADHESYNNRGNVYFEQNKNELAIADYDKAIFYKPDFFRVYDNRGAAYARLGKYDLALKDFEKAIALNPNYEKSYYNRGIVYMMQEKANEAIADFEKYLKIKKEDAGIENSIGYCYQLLNKHDKAIIAFDRALKIEQNGIFYQNRAISNSQLGKKDLAKMDIENAQRLGVKVKPELIEYLKK